MGNVSLATERMGKDVQCFGVSWCLMHDGRCLDGSGVRLGAQLLRMQNNVEEMIKWFIDYLPDLMKWKVARCPFNYSDYAFFCHLERSLFGLQWLSSALCDQESCKNTHVYFLVSSISLIQNGGILTLLPITYISRIFYRKYSLGSLTTTPRLAQTSSMPISGLPLSHPYVSLVIPNEGISTWHSLISESVGRLSVATGSVGVPKHNVLD